ncbi:sigma-54 dependent transcriptional regulator [Nitratireductor sp. StC3]|uniref:sigma-54-dependent transcriptional regulator n=1 Tax=Nitratireductor sp. StC3 TaxID=2126741 RepID=UPI000D0DA10A|nr:sigma-54 dependent transcriptional regulator [Nitratireductor sp. StC3]PSM17674.1 Fis family transcriptional regulator [Nitratireductor sp. StC3]
MSDARVLLVDDDDDLRPALVQGFEIEDLAVTAYRSAEEALPDIGRELYGCIVTDIRMAGMGGMELMRRCLEIDPALPVVLITGHGEVALAVQAMRDGAYDFIEKPFPVHRLTSVVRRAIEKRRLVLENRVLRETLDASGDLESRLVGRNPAMRRLREEIAALAGTDADVLILGETGSGKEVVARALHDFGDRARANFVAINCGALPKEIFESELFGHEAGAFTGAQKMRIGKLEHADGGTVFLDEIESMPLELQVKLLRAIEHRTVERLGSNRSIPLDVRFVAASKADLKAESEARRFRADLFYRLNVATLKIAPLRERGDDIPLLFTHLAREARARYRRDMPEMNPALEAELTAHDWPGNVRELRNVADRWVLGLWRGFSPDAPVAAGGASTLADRLAAFERSVIEAELKRHGGRQKETYEALGISRKGLYDKMKKLGLGGHDDG